MKVRYDRKTDTLILVLRDNTAVVESGGIGGRILGFVIQMIGSQILRRQSFGAGS